MIAALVALLLAQQATSEATRIERIAALGKLWGFVRIFHPSLPASDLDWDKALVTALPAATDSKDADEFAAVAQSMLAVLEDPATRVAAKEIATPSHPLAFREIESGLLVIRIGAVKAADSAQILGALKAVLSKARSVVIDSRGTTATIEGVRDLGQLLAEALPRRELQGSASRYLYHSGWRPQARPEANNYETLFVVRPGQMGANRCMDRLYKRRVASRLGYRRKGSSA